MNVHRLELLEAAAAAAAEESAPLSALMFAGGEPYGDSVRRRKRDPADPRPSHLYLVYIALDGNGLKVRHVEKDIDPNQLVAEENNLIQDAIAGNNNQAGSNFDLLEFTKPTNFTIVLDVDGWEFYYPDSSNPHPDFLDTHDPIVFISEKTFINPDGTPQFSLPARRNFSFYDLEPVIKTIGGVNRNAIRCINYWKKNPAGDSPGINEKIDYSFNLFLRVPFSNTTNKKITIILDPDGQNQGPPQ